MVANILSLLRRHEGLRLTPYKCTAGKLSIGYGRNLSSGISISEAEVLLINDVERCLKDASKFTWWFDLDEVRQTVIVSMIYNLGYSKFLTFNKFLHYVSIKDYSGASIEMMNSKWASQVGNRAKELSEIMRSGVFPN